jgi:hypothetical protein
MFVAVSDAAETGCVEHFGGVESVRVNGAVKGRGNVSRRRIIRW